MTTGTGASVDNLSIFPGGFKLMDIHVRNHENLPKDSRLVEPRATCYGEPIGDFSHNTLFENENITIFGNIVF